MPVNNQLARENWERYTYARDNGHTDYVRKAKQCDEYFAGIHWDDVLKRKLDRQRKPTVTINETFATLMTIMGEQIQNRADIAFTPSKDGIEQTAKSLNKLYIAITNANKLDWLESEMSADGFITSRGFLDARIDFEDQMKGEVKISLLNPKNVVIDPDAEQYDPSTWKEVFLTKWLTPDDIAVLHNKQDAELLRRRSKDDFEFGYDSFDIHGRDTFGGSVREGDDRDSRQRRNIRVIERQYKKLRMREHFVDPRTGDMRPVPDNWDYNRISYVKDQYDLRIFKKIAEQIRWTVTADDVVLHDKWSPYKFLTPVPFFPVFRRGRTIGLVENLISPQDVLNKATSQELHVINTTANSGWKLKTGSLQNMDPEELEVRGAETGLVLELSDVNDAEKIQPNQVPTGLDRVSFKAKEHMKSISNVSESQRGLDRADVAARAIQAKQAAGSTNLAKPFDNLARTRHMLAERILNLIQTYYTEERVVQVTGRGLQAKTEDLVINQVTPEGEVVNDLTVGEYAATVTTVPARDTYKQSQLEEALRMRELGVNIPDDVVIDNSTLDNKSEVAERIKQLNGGAEPSESQMQLAELEVEAKRLENAEKEIEIQRKAADAKLAEARAEKTLVEARSQGQEEGNPEAELTLQREKQALEHQEALARIQGELDIKRRAMEAEIEMKREKMRQENLLRRAEAEERLEQQAQQQKTQQETA